MGRALIWGLFSVALSLAFGPGCSSSDDEAKSVGSKQDAGGTDGAAADGAADAADASADADAGSVSEGGAEGGNDCTAVDCGKFGHCELSAGVASCVCDAGYHAEGLACVMDPCTGTDCPRSVAEWQALFDAEWKAKDQTQCTTNAQSGGYDQEHYFLAYCIDGMTSIWRATGDDSYLDTNLQLIQDTLDDAKLGSDGYYRWDSNLGPDGVPLWESYYWRMVVTLVRVMHQNPQLLSKKDYGKRYQALLDFSEHDIWDKWESAGLNNLYRSRTHMASHWARIGMELYRITGKAKYKTVFDNISGGTMVGWPSNLSQQFYPNPKVPTAYTWAQVWGAPKGQDVQDTSHGGAVVSFVELAAEAGMYWKPSDVDALRSTVSDVIWPAALGQNYYRNVDGSGGLYGPKPGNTIDLIHGRLHEWLVLGRHDLTLQKRIEQDYVGNHLKYYGTEALGIAALNAKILIDGAPAY
ncbi:MAG: hypothetical protein R3B13_05355 [Polyangiaceae bacterium]